MVITSPRGTQDIVPAESYKWQAVEKVLRETATLFGFLEIRTPTFEDVNLFSRGVGGSTDIVQKEMYEVKPQKGEDTYALKPEGTAGVVRACLERGLLNDALPQKLFYITPCFRHERPQAGRLREFHQLGCEVLGSSSPVCDVQMITLINAIIAKLSLKNISLHINSIGCKTCRTEYSNKLREYFAPHEAQLCETCKQRLKTNPMRILDCKCPECNKIASGINGEPPAPVMMDYLCDDCKTHFEKVKELLDALSISYLVDTKIVRGLDYYTKTVFEFIAEDIGAQSTVFGGGRYDGLVEELGGKPTPALGFAMGIERLLMVMDAQGLALKKPPQCDIYIGSYDENAAKKAMELSTKLRFRGINAECDLMGRSVKAQMKYANKIGAKRSFIIGESELLSQSAKVKDMDTGIDSEMTFEDVLNIKI